MKRGGVDDAVDARECDGRAKTRGLDSEGGIESRGGGLGHDGDACRGGGLAAPPEQSAPYFKQAHCGDEELVGLGQSRSSRRSRPERQLLRSLTPIRGATMGPEQLSV